MGDASEAEKGERIAKRLARAGLCSRRDAERWIAEGRVSVDGKVLTTPAVLVTAQSRILVDGKPIAAPEPTRLWRYHKPRGLVTTERDPQGRPTIFQSLPPGLPRVVKVGRLDLNSEGLMLLTNDGALARYLELPTTGWVRRYRVRVHGRVDPQRLHALEHGVTIAGVSYGSVEAELERQQGSNAWLTFALREGKNREVRRICEHLDLVVTRLIRTSYGPFQLGSLPRGAVEEVPRKVLEEQLPRDVLSAIDQGSGVEGTDRPAGKPSLGNQRPGKPEPDRQTLRRQGAGKPRPGKQRTGKERPGKPRSEKHGAGKRGNDRQGSTRRKPS